MIKKPGKKIRHCKTKAEREHLNYIASLPCVVCGAVPVQVHHVRILNEKRDHSKCLPLCYDHHLGENGIHTLGKKEWRKRFGSELDMIGKLNKPL